MANPTSDYMVRALIKDIILSCESKGEMVSDKTVAVLVKAIMKDPIDMINPNCLSPEDVDNMLHICTEILTSKSSFTGTTIKMQAVFCSNYDSKENYFKEHERLVSQKCKPILEDIVHSSGRNKDNLDSLYQKIIGCLVLMSGLGNPSDREVLREAMAALQSVLPREELVHFVSSPKQMKIKQIDELNNIVIGIRLFNKFNSSQKLGQRIENIPEILREAIPTAIENVDEELDHTRQLTYKVTAILEQVLLRRGEENFLAFEQIEEMKEALINYRQLECFLEKIIKDMVFLQKSANEQRDNFNQQLSELKDIISHKKALPTTQVYPRFIKLSKTWKSLRDETIYLSILTSIFSNIQPLKVKETSVDGLQTSLRYTIMTDQEREAKEKDNIIGNNEVNCHVLFPSSTNNLEELEFAYAGFCCWALVEGKGMLLRGIPEIGILLFENQYYVFSSKKAAEEFGQMPREYVDRGDFLSRSMPELVYLMNVDHEMDIRSGDVKKKPIVAKENKDLQTEMHPIRTNIDPSHMWNEWDIRREAIKMTNLTHMLTHSTQTGKSHLKRDSETQVYSPRTSGTQTMASTGTCVPRPETYIAGLRGLPSRTIPPGKINLTRDVIED